MTPSDSLFRLIKSLTKSEKRYFKIHAQRHVIKGENSYIKLFDAIEKQKEFNEEKLKKQFAKEPFVKHFASVKKYLNNLVLKSLHMYHDDSSVNAKLSEMMHNTHLLYKKSLYKEAIDMVENAKKIARKHDRYVKLLEILDAEMWLYRQIGNIDYLEKNLSSITEEVFWAIKQLKNEIHFSILEFNAFLYVNLDDPNNKKHKEIQQLMNHRLLANEKNALNITAKIAYYDIKIAFYARKKDYLSEYKIRKKICDLYYQNPLYIQERPDKYMISLQRLVILSIYRKKIDDAFLYLDKLKASIELLSQRALTSRIEKWHFFNSRLLEIVIHINLDNHNKPLPLIPEIEARFNDLNELRRTKAYVIYIVSLFYFGNGNISKSMKWLNMIVNESSYAEYDHSIYTWSRIVQVIIQYELKNYELAISYVHSLIRFLSHNQDSYAIELAVLNFIKKQLNGAYAGKETFSGFNKFKTELLKLSGKSKGNDAMEYFDILSWIDSKIEQKPFSEIVKRKAEMCRMGLLNLV